MRTVAFVLIAFLLASLCSAQQTSVPPFVNYQGRLTDEQGNPLPTADYTLSFRVYAAATQGTECWGPQVFDGNPGTGHGDQVPVVQGHFNVILGPLDTRGASILDAFDPKALEFPEECAASGARYIETAVDGSSILPRQQILSAPYALNARNAENAGNAQLAGGIDVVSRFEQLELALEELPGTLGPRVLFHGTIQQPSGQILTGGGFSMIQRVAAGRYNLAPDVPFTRPPTIIVNGKVGFYCGVTTSPEANLLNQFFQVGCNNENTNGNADPSFIGIIALE